MMYQECRWCDEGNEPEWSYDAKVWIHRRERLDRRCENPPIRRLRQALELAINTVECASLDRDGKELPWYVRAKNALAATEWLERRPAKVGPAEPQNPHTVKCIHCDKPLTQHAAFARCDGGKTQFTAAEHSVDWCEPREEINCEARCENCGAFYDSKWIGTACSVCDGLINHFERGPAKAGAADTPCVQCGGIGKHFHVDGTPLEDLRQKRGDGIPLDNGVLTHEQVAERWRKEQGMK